MERDLEAFVEIIRDLRRIEQQLHRLETGQGSEGSGLPAPNGTYSLLYSSNDYNASYTEWDGELVHPASANYVIVSSAASFSWIDATTAWPAPGSTKQIIYNNAGVLAGAGGFEYQAAASPNVFIQAQNAAYVPLVVKGAGAQTASLLQLQESDGSVFLDSGDGLAASEFVINEQGEDIDVRIEGGTITNLLVTNSGNNHVETHGGRIQSTTRIDSGDSPYTTLNTDDVLFADTDGGAITINLQAGVEGRRLRIVNCGSSGNAITVEGDGAETVWGAANATLNDGDILIIVYNATEGWW